MVTFTGGVNSALPSELPPLSLRLPSSSSSSSGSLSLRGGGDVFGGFLFLLHRGTTVLLIVSRGSNPHLGVSRGGPFHLSSSRSRDFLVFLGRNKVRTRRLNTHDIRHVSACTGHTFSSCWTRDAPPPWPGVRAATLPTPHKEAASGLRFRRTRHPRRLSSGPLLSLPSSQRRRPLFFFHAISFARLNTFISRWFSASAAFARNTT